MTGGFAEPDAEEAALGWLGTLGYAVKHGPQIAYNDGGERTDPGYHDRSAKPASRPAAIYGMLPPPRSAASSGSAE